MPLGGPGPRISAVIPCRNESTYVVRLLEALRAQSHPPNEIVVVDGGSTDDTWEKVERYSRAYPEAGIRLHRQPSGTIPANLNLGITHATGEVIARFDGHAIPGADYLSRCLAALESSGAEVIGGAWAIRPGAPGRVAQAIALAVGSPLGAGDAYYRLNSSRQPRDVDTVPYGCFRRRTWEIVGGYNERLLANEDYEFNLRVRLRGGRVHFDPAIRCEYFARASVRELARQYWRYGWWKAQMLIQHPHSLRPRQAIPLLWALGSLTLVTLALFLPSFRFPAAFLWGVYLSALAIGAAWLAFPLRPSLWPSLMLAFGVIHFSWGLAAWAGLASRVYQTLLRER